MPVHVAIIMDGNGRWARRQGLPRIEGHRRGVENVREIAETAREIGIRYLTLYAFSAENWARPAEEIEALMELLYQFLGEHTKTLIENQTRFRTIGRTSELPERIQQLIDDAVKSTEHFDQQTLVLALNYGARTEMIDALKGFYRAATAGEVDVDQLDWNTVARFLYTADIPDPDLLIRTSGEARISNFLLMQCAYAELFFTPVLWPEFGRAQFMEAIQSYQKRERRFGKTGEQVSAK